MLDPRTFLGLCVSGEAKIEDVDDWVDRWHEGDSIVPLHEYLGMTWEEYGNLILSSGVLVHIVEIRRLVEEGRTAMLKGAAEARNGLN